MSLKKCHYRNIELDKDWSWKGPLRIKLLSYWSAPTYWCLGLCLAQCRTLHFPLLNFRRFPLARLSSLIRLLWTTAQPSGTEATLPCAISIHGEGMLCPIIQIISEDVDQELLITGCCTTGHHPPGPAVFNVPLVCSSSPHFISFSMRKPRLCPLAHTFILILKKSTEVSVLTQGLFFKEKWKSEFLILSITFYIILTYIE